MRNPYLVDSGPDEPWAWQLRGACRGQWDVFFPAVGQHADRARAICGGCPVQVECGEYAVTTGETEGTWGGLSAEELKERRQPRRRRRPGRPRKDAA
jgi:WhiB family redox-sensing transcriptional regulator